MFYYAMIVMELGNEHVRAAIENEAGDTYIYSIYIGFILVLLSHALGLAWGKREKQLKVKNAL
jgi:hypothetical protein